MPGRAASATTGKLMGQRRASSWCGVRKYGQIAALAMATRGKGNDRQTATLVMATHDKGDDGQIAAPPWATGMLGKLMACAGSATMGESLCLQWPHAARAMMGKSLAHAMATHSKGDSGRIAGARGNSNINQVNGMHRECNQNCNHPTMDGGVQWRWHWTTMHQSN